MKKTIVAVLAALTASLTLASCDVQLPDFLNKSSGSSSEEQSSSVSSVEESSSLTGSTSSEGENFGNSSEAEGGKQDSSNSSSGGSETHYDYTAFTPTEKALFEKIIGEVIPFLPNNEYYVEEYTLDYEDGTGEGESGVNFYTFGNTKTEFDAYRAKYSDSEDYEFFDSAKDEYGDMWYYYDAEDYYVDMSYYEDEGVYVVDVYAYIIVDMDDITDDSSSSGGSSGGNSSSDEVDLITNEGKGLPTGENGVYSVDFTKAEYVKNVTEQGYYLDGCPTVGNVNVLVIPVEFSDVTASSKGYSIDKLKAAFNGSETDSTYVSVKEFYSVSSYGKLNLTFTVCDDWFRPENASTYYAKQKLEGYFIGDQMIMDEALAYWSKTMDLSKFDSDNNQIIDAVVLINTMDVDSSVETAFQWAYRYWNIYTDVNDEYYEYDGVSANDYLWASYQFLLESYDDDGNTIYDKNVMNTYTYIHEFGHVLGADDYYDTSYSETEHSPLGYFDVMDGMLGDHNPYTKFNYGWLTSSRLVVAEESVTLTLDDFFKAGDTIIIANNWDDDLGVYQEYYIVMYYRRVGLNDRDNDMGYFDRDGIVVYHVNASLYKEVYDGEEYYDVYNNNTDSSDEYGTEDDLIEFVKCTSSAESGTFTYIVGDSLSSTLTDDQGNKISYTFTVDSLTDDAATLTFTKNS